jgi:hypothetical protein
MDKLPMPFRAPPPKRQNNAVESPARKKKKKYHSSIPNNEHRSDYALGSSEGMLPGLPLTRVGAILLRLGAEGSSASDSLVSLLRLEFVAVMLGTCPDISGGLLLIAVGAAEDCVTIDDVEFDRVGEAGL